MKICSLGAELFHAESRTDRRIGMTTVLVAFRNFANASKIILHIVHARVSESSVTLPN
jgi:hypothetical protein